MNMLPADIVMKTMFRNWAMSFGAIALLLLLSIFLPMWWLPFMAIVEWFLLVSAVKSSEQRPGSYCSLVTRMAAQTMALSALVMTVLLVIYTDRILPQFVELPLYNRELPFIAALIVWPVTMVVCALMLYGGMSGRRCRECQKRNGNFPGDNIVATLYQRESKYQLKVLLLVSLTLGAVDYWYYFARYVNSDLNNPDRFFFSYMPIGVYLISLAVMHSRYAAMHSVYQSMAAESAAGEASTEVRFLILCGNDLLLVQNDKTSKWDTPAITAIGRTLSIGEREAELLLATATGLRDCPLRYGFTTQGFANGSNVIHFFAFVGEDRRAAAATGGREWFNPYMLDAALATNSLSPQLAAELFRIHTITMAWKTYDRNGHRLYPIKNYRPTFRLGDIRKWDVDYDDTHWFAIAATNEDRHFFGLHRLWDIITGIFSRKACQK